MLPSSVKLLTNSVLTDAKTLLTSPTIGLPLSADLNTALGENSKLAKALSFMKNIGVFRGVPIFTEEFEELGQVQIGKQVVLVAQGGAKTLTDNVVVQPRQWTIKGYITGIQMQSIYQQLMRLSLLSTLEGILGGLENEILIQLSKLYIRWVRDTRVPFYFYTREGEQVNALIERYRFVDIPEADNACKVELTIDEYIALESTANGTSVPDANSPKLGSIWADPVRATSLLASSFAVVNPLVQAFVDVPVLGAVALTVLAVVNSFDTVDRTSYDNTYTNAEGKEEDISQVEVTDDSMLQSVSDTMKITSNQLRAMINKTRGNTVYVVDFPFAELATTNENGEQEIVPHVTTSVTFDNDHIDFTLRRNQYLQDVWWLTEEGSVGAEEVSTNDRVVFNTFIHSTWSWSFMLVSKYLPADGSTTWADLNEEQRIDALTTCSLVIAA